MFDYSLDKYEKKDFILNFEEDGDIIKVNLANGEDYTVPNTKENRDKLLSTMEYQVENSWAYESKKKKERKNARNWMIYDGAFLALNLVTIFLNPSVLTTVAICCFAIAIVGNALSYHFIGEALKELDKNQIFLRNKNQINEYLKRGNEEIKDKTLNPVEKDEDALTINDVHSMTHEDVSKIINDINRDEKFGIDRPKVLTKNYISKTK